MSIDSCVKTGEREIKSQEGKSHLPFLATIKERYWLNPGSEKKTYHLTLDLEGSDIDYRVGDCLCICPENDPAYVDQILAYFNVSGSEEIVDRANIPHSFRDFLLKKANLVRIPKKILNQYTSLTQALQHQSFDPQVFCASLSPLLPRYYSIASSMDVVGKEAHLVVALTENPPDFPIPFGTCSRYLCVEAPLGRPIVPLFLHRSRNFILPEESDEKPIIMIGPGTGVAPFRGFLQERLRRKANSRNWLFFGERNLATDFYYREEWNKLVEMGFLQLSYAFSRDQTDKVYVQHKMVESASTLWKWLQEGAYLFVCGDAERMAKDVDQTLISILQREGALSVPEAKTYIKVLKEAGRYQRDVY